MKDDSSISKRSKHVAQNEQKQKVVHVSLQCVGQSTIGEDRTRKKRLEKKSAARKPNDTSSLSKSCNPVAALNFLPNRNPLLEQKLSQNKASVMQRLPSPKYAFVYSRELLFFTRFVSWRDACRPIFRTRERRGLDSRTRVIASTRYNNHKVFTDQATLKRRQNEIKDHRGNKLRLTEQAATSVKFSGLVCVTASGRWSFVGNSSDEQGADLGSPLGKPSWLGK